MHPTFQQAPVSPIRSGIEKLAIESEGSNCRVLQHATGKTMRVATYGRFSNDQQKITSIDDQLRMVRETAVRFGLVVSDELVFTDEAITGAQKAINKREQYAALRRAICRGDVDVLICDQLCRLARHAAEALNFFDELKSHGVRLLTADGFDSAAPTAQLLFGMKSVFAQFFLEETRHRVMRGMAGEFQRGSMVTAIPYGYRLDAERSAAVGHCCWMVEPLSAEVVRTVFRRRKEGMSLNQIAAILNAGNVATPRSKNGDERLYWRASSVWRMLQNPTYKGVYQVNFGKGEGDSNDAGIKQRLMPEFVLVDVADWDLCQSLGKGSRCVERAGASDEAARCVQKVRYGGGKHPLAGVLRCGVCDATLSCHHGAGDGGSMHCVQCEHATNVGVPGRQPAYVSIKGVRVMLRWLLERIVCGEAVLRYRERLRERLLGGQAAELMAVQEHLRKAQRTRDRLARVLAEIGEDDAVLERQYVRAREEVMHLARRESELAAGLQAVDHAAIQQQLDVDLSAVIDSFLSDTNTPERTRAVLTRIFPRIVLREKTGRFTAIFDVDVRPGAILAEASGTKELAEGCERLSVRLKTSGPKHPVWSVAAIDPLLLGQEASAIQ